MSFFSRSLGTGISALGALLVLCGTFLPTYGSGDYEPAGFRRAPVFLFMLLVVPSLLVLLSSGFTWFLPLPRWLVMLGLVMNSLALVLHLLGSLLGSAFACFDVCPPGGVQFGTGFWLPLLGFLLSVLGLAVVAAAEKWRTWPGTPTDSS